MKIEPLAFLFLAFYLILDGILNLVSGSATAAILGLLALVAGVLFLLNYVPRGTRRRR